MNNIHAVSCFANATVGVSAAHAFLYRFLLVLLLGVPLSSGRVAAQTVSHPTSEVTSTAKYYSYTHMLSATEKKELEYILVRASNGDIKTVFNACDVCYLAYKGYSQSGTQLRCNNCGNRFEIDGLGNKNTGGTCNPGYLPHTIDGDNVLINVSDLVTGAYYFRLQTVTGLANDANRPEVLAMTQDRQNLTLTLPREGRRSFHIFTLNGQHRAAITDASRQVRIPIGGFSCGPYVLLIEEANAVTSKLFLVY
jgi:hypothetical protein